MQVVILCGGLGTRLREETEFKPKPMVEVGNRPIVWHIMNHYAAHGFKEFILCLGYKGEVIRNYFVNYHLLTSDLTCVLSCPPRIEYHRVEEQPWKVTMVDTGKLANTGARLKRVQKYVQGRFMLTYGDGLTDLDLHQLIATHERQGRLATVTGVAPPARFGELVEEGGLVTQFREKPDLQDALISGGFFVLEPQVFDYLSDEDACNFEKGPLEQLAGEGQLAVHRHAGFWQCMDTFRDYTLLNELWSSGRAPWAPPQPA